MMILARLAGEDKPQGIFEWLRYRKLAFAQIYGLKKARTPCLNTIRTILDEVMEGPDSRAALCIRSTKGMAAWRLAP
jgi:hypothetical protein